MTCISLGGPSNPKSTVGTQLPVRRPRVITFQARGMFTKGPCKWYPWRPLPSHLHQVRFEALSTPKSKDCWGWTCVTPWLLLSPYLCIALVQLVIHGYGCRSPAVCPVKAKQKPLIIRNLLQRALNNNYGEYNRHTHTHKQSVAPQAS